MHILSLIIAIVMLGIGGFFYFFCPVPLVALPFLMIALGMGTLGLFGD